MELFATGSLNRAQKESRGDARALDHLSFRGGNAARFCARIMPH